MNSVVDGLVAEVIQDGVDLTNTTFHLYGTPPFRLGRAHFWAYLRRRAAPYTVSGTQNPPPVSRCEILDAKETEPCSKLVFSATGP